MGTRKYFDKDGWFKEEYLWPLRKQIILGSLYISDYRNSFGIDEEKVCEFFTSFWDSYCEELATEDNLYAEAERIYLASLDDGDTINRSAIDFQYLDLQRERYDNEETLKSWYGCFCDECPLPRVDYQKLASEAQNTIDYYG